MDDIVTKIEQIYKQLEEDRKKALEEYDQIRDEAALVDTRYRHKVREVGGQLLKLAVEASVGMAKILEPLLKNEAAASSFSGRKDLLELIEKMDTKEVVEEKGLDDGTGTLEEELQEAKDA